MYPARVSWIACTRDGNLFSMGSETNSNEKRCLKKGLVWFGLVASSRPPSGPRAVRLSHRPQLHHHRHPNWPLERGWDHWWPVGGTVDCGDGFAMRGEQRLRTAVRRSRRDM